MLRDPHLLESALNRPQQAAHYRGATLLEQCAILVESIAMAHAFVDGNKRTAALASGAFLAVNGVTITETTALGPLIENLVTHAITKDDLAKWLYSHTISQK